MPGFKKAQGCIQIVFTISYDRLQVIANLNCMHLTMLPTVSRWQANSDQGRS